MDNSFAPVISQLWEATSQQGESIQLSHPPVVTGPRTVLPSAFDVTGLASGAVAVATQAAANLLAIRQATDIPAVSVDSQESCAAFRAEALFSPQGWVLPPLWDPIAGNYQTIDGWIRLHTNYATHRAVVERVLEASDRDSVQAAVANQRGVDMERAVVDAGAPAAVMHTREEWLASEAGMATATAPPFTVTDRPVSTPARWESVPPHAPFSGLRVLDITRVLAGPACTKFFAAFGADVLRVDPPRFQEVAALLPETTHGKRTVALDFNNSADRTVFEELVAGADVIVTGLRSDALDKLGYDTTSLLTLNPGVILASLNAYGWVGPWWHRRGFDSLIQMSCGIAATGTTGTPNPLPAQALDYGTGWLLATAITRALSRRLTDAVAATITTSLVSTAKLLYELTTLTGVNNTVPAGNLDTTLEPRSTEWGPALCAPFPAHISGIQPHFVYRAGPLGRHQATWLH